MNKKILFAFLTALTMGIAGAAFAADETFRVPSSNNGHPDVHGRYGAVDKVTLITSSDPAKITDADGTALTAGLIYWIVRPATAAAGAFLELRDTDTANVSSTKMLPWIPAISTSQVVLPFNTQVLTFDPPIPFYNGLSVNIYPQSAAAAAEWAIGTRPRR